MILVGKQLAARLGVASAFPIQEPIGGTMVRGVRTMISKRASGAAQKTDRVWHRPPQKILSEIDEY